MYKKKIIGTIICLILNVVIGFVEYISESSEGLSPLFVITFFGFLCFVIYWIYVLDRFALYPLLFGNFKKQNTFKKVLYVACCLILFPWTIFLYLIEIPKFTLLNDKLTEKDPTGSSIRKVTLLDKKTNELVYYSQYDDSKEKLYSIFNVEYIAGLRARKYIVYKCDPRYMVLMSYAEISMYPEHDNKVALNYLTVSYGALLYYKKEIKNLNKQYLELKKKHDNALSEKKIDVLVEIQKFLMLSKLNNMKYSDVVKTMVLASNYANLKEIKIWHNYFKNETDKQSIKVAKLLDKLNEDFKIIITNYSNEDKKIINDQANKDINK